MPTLPAFLRRLFGRSLDPAPPAPSPGGVVLRFTDHPQGDIPCRTAVSAGLGASIALTVRRDRDVDLQGWAALLEGIADRPEADDWLRPWGGLTSTRGLLGGDRYHRALLIPPVPLVGVPGTESALAAILLDDDEAAWIDRIGPTRVLARLGLQHRWFPTTPWADPVRPGVVDPVREHADPLNRLPTMFRPAASVTRTGDGSALVQLAPLGPDHPAPLRILVPVAPGVDAVVVHRPAGDIAALSARTGTGRMALGGLIVAIEDVDAVVFVDDLLVVQCTEAGWVRFWAAVRRGGELIHGQARLTFVPEGADVHLPPMGGRVRSIVFARPSDPRGSVDPDALAASVAALVQCLEQAPLAGRGRLHVQLDTPAKCRFDGPFRADPGALEGVLHELATLPFPADAHGLRLTLDLDAG